MWRRGLVAPIILLVACSSDDQVCLDYACINEVRLTGTVSFPTMPAAVDVSFCSQGTCQTGTIDLTTGTESCARWELSSVCLNPAAAAFSLTAVWATTEDGKPPPAGAEYHLVLTDHTTLDTVLDVSTAATYTVSQQDACHVCWSGQAEL